MSFQPNSSAFCQGVFVFGNKKRIFDPARKHCQLGTGQFWDLVRGDIKGDDGRGERLSTAPWFIVADKYLKINIEMLEKWSNNNKG